MVTRKKYLIRPVALRPDQWAVIDKQKAGTRPDYIRKALDAFDPKEVDLVLQVATKNEAAKIRRQLARAKTLKEGETLTIQGFNVPITVYAETKVMVSVRSPKTA